MAGVVEIEDLLGQLDLAAAVARSSISCEGADSASETFFVSSKTALVGSQVVPLELPQVQLQSLAGLQALARAVPRTEPDEWMRW